MNKYLQTAVDILEKHPGRFYLTLKSCFWDKDKNKKAFAKLTKNTGNLYFSTIDELKKSFNDFKSEKNAVNPCVMIDAGRSRLVIIDDDGGDFIKICGENNIELQDTFRVKTGKGVHYYFSIPEPMQLLKSKMSIFKGIDLFCDKEGKDTYEPAFIGSVRINDSEGNEIQYQSIGDLGNIQIIPRKLYQLLESKIKDSEPKKKNDLKESDIYTKNDNGLIIDGKNDFILKFIQSKAVDFLIDNGLNSEADPSTEWGWKIEASNHCDWSNVSNINSYLKAVSNPNYKEARKIAQRRIEFEQKEHQLNEIEKDVSQKFSFYFKTFIGSKMLIVDYRDLEKSRVLTHIRADFLNYYSDNLVNIGTDSKPKMIRDSELWVNKLAPRYKGFIFNPHPDYNDPDYFNTWSGFYFKIKPREEIGTDHHLFLDFLRNIICGGDDSKYIWTVKYLAHLIQQPHEKPGIALGIRGGQGTGKGTFFSCLAFMIGGPSERYCNRPESMDKLTGQFNSDIDNKLLIYCDEISFSGSIREKNQLKKLITEPMLSVRYLYAESIMKSSCFRLIIASNENHFLNLEADDRRFVVYETPEGSKKEVEYYFSVLESIKNGGGEDLISFLFHHAPVSIIDLKKTMPKNDYLKERQKVVSFNDIIHFMVALIEDPGYFLDVVDDEIDLKASDLFSAFYDKFSLKKSNLNYKSFGMKLSDYFLKPDSGIERKRHSTGNFYTLNFELLKKFIKINFSSALFDDIEDDNQEARFINPYKNADY